MGVPLGVCENNIVGTYNLIFKIFKYIFNISSQLCKIWVKVPRSFLFAKLASPYV